MRGTTRTVAVAGISAAALLAAGCGGGDRQRRHQLQRRGQDRRRCHGPRVQPREPPGPGQHDRDLWWQRARRRHGQARPVQRRDRCSRERHRGVDRDHGQPELHRQAQEGLQVPRRHRGQGEELRRRLELRRLRPERPARLATSSSPSRATPTCSPRTRTATSPQKAPQAQGQEADRSRGRGRLHLHDQDRPRRSRTFPSASATRPSRRCPDAFFADPKAFGEKPIGAGPFKFDSWTKNTEIKLSQVR